MAKKKKLKTKTEEIRKLSAGDLGKQLDESYRRLFSLHLEKETLKLTNHNELPRTRRLIARLKTIERERAIAQAAGSAAER